MLVTLSTASLVILYT